MITARRLYKPSYRLIVTGILMAASLAWTNQALATSSEPAWDNPSAVSVKKLATVPANPAGRIAFEDNLDCHVMSYRLNATDQPTTGCYQSTVFGSLDVRSGLINFAGNEELVVPLKTYGSREILLPWPNSNAVLSAYSSPPGVNLGLYTNILGVTEDKRDLLGRVVEKQVTRPANVQLKNASGQNLLANFNSIAFSDNGHWLIAEGYDGYFIRINLATLSVTPFAASYSASGGFNQSQVAVTDDGRYVAITNYLAKSF